MQLLMLKLRHSILLIKLLDDWHILCVRTLSMCPWESRRRWMLNCIWHRTIICAHGYTLYPIRYTHTAQSASWVIRGQSAGSRYTCVWLCNVSGPKPNCYMIFCPQKMFWESVSLHPNLRCATQNKIHFHSHKSTVNEDKNMAQWYLSILCYVFGPVLCVSLFSLDLDLPRSESRWPIHLGRMIMAYVLSTLSIEHHKFWRYKFVGSFRAGLINEFARLVLFGGQFCLSEVSYSYMANNIFLLHVIR